ncbi:hypothetical protein [Streptomyces sp. NPDC048521]|uniref:hypothetical protein n=1 Tax=Streptomyces sp. NPDC048521 TaxID=3365566 RepID=UPI0037167D07
MAACIVPAGGRTLLLGRLLSAADPAARPRVVRVVRAEHGEPARALRDSTPLPGPMTPHRPREAVVRPAGSSWNAP